MAFCKQYHLSLGFHISAVFAIVCCYSALCADGYSLYTDSWAVEINGGRHIADKLAKKHGFINAGEVGNLKDIYHFIFNDGSRGNAKQYKHRIRPIHFLEDKLRTIALQREDNVRYVKQQQLLHMEKKSYSPPYDPQWHSQWSLQNEGQTSGPIGLDLNVEGAWIQGITGRGVVVSVVDDGVEKSHPDLQINFDSQASWDFVNHDGDPTPAGSDEHGTACAGIIAMARNGVCGVGVAPGISLGGLRLNISYTTDLLQATVLSYHDSYVDVYSNSWGPMETGFTVGHPGYFTLHTFQTETAQGRNKKGSIYVFASGNGGGHHDSCAADGFVNSIYTIAVGSADQNGRQAHYDEDCSAKMAVTFSYNSNTSTPPDKKTKQLLTTSLNGHCSDSFTGTSASAPLLSGVIALTLEANPDLTWRDVQYLIAYTSNPDILTGDDWVTNRAGLKVSHHFGFGAIDAEAMVTRARHWTNVPQQVSQSFSLHSIQDIEASSFGVVEFTVDNSKPDFNTVQFLEHVILTITLEVRGYEQEYSVQDFFHYQDSVSNDTEQLITWLKDVHPRRGDVEIKLTSPQGTTSTLLPYRNYDFVNSEGYQNWPFMTVHNWGENPNGTWSLRINYRSSSGYVHVDKVNLTLYGTYVTPKSIRAIPSQCDIACERSCSGEGLTMCDVCKGLRLDSTLECVDVCPFGYSEYKSYCLNDDGESSNLASSFPTENVTENASTADDENQGGEETLQLGVSIIFSGVVILLILLFAIIASYFAIQLAHQNCHKKHQASFVRLEENIYSTTSV